MCSDRPFFSHFSVPKLDSANVKRVRVFRRTAPAPSFIIILVISPFVPGWYLAGTWLVHAQSSIPYNIHFLRAIYQTSWRRIGHWIVPSIGMTSRCNLSSLVTLYCLVAPPSPPSVVLSENDDSVGLSFIISSCLVATENHSAFHCGEGKSIWGCCPSCEIVVLLNQSAAFDIFYLETSQPPSQH